eukprot:evm.model.scf_274.7 EVM.evm.TU.scf_274.7   scf_274:52324-61265(-)
MGVVNLKGGLLVLLVVAAVSGKAFADEDIRGAPGRHDRNPNPYAVPHFFEEGFPPIYGWIFWYEDDAPESEVEVLLSEKSIGARNCRKYNKILRAVACQMSTGHLRRIVEQQKSVLKAVYRNGAIRGFGLEKDPGWGLDRLDQLSETLDGYYHYPSEGLGVNVYVVDTGILTTHTEFAEEEGPRAKFAFSVFGDDDDRRDCNGHGTHVAGIVGGANFGVAKGATIWDIRALDCNKSASFADTVAALDWIATNAESPAVAVLSLGGYANDLLDTAAEQLVEGGVPVLSAAGNSREDACLWSPARTDACITVGASTPTDMIYPNSNFGPCVDIFAPGERILGAGTGSDEEGVYRSGTSMATPFVAGVAALFLQIHPAATPQEVRDAVMAAALQGPVENLPPNTTNRLLNVENLLPVLSAAGGDVFLEHDGGEASRTCSDVSLDREPTADVAVALSVDAAAGAVEPARIAFSPSNWSEPANVCLVPNPLHYLSGATAFVEASVQSDDASYRGVHDAVRIVDLKARRPGDSLDAPFAIPALPFDMAQHTPLFSDNVSVICEGHPENGYPSPEMVFEFSPAVSANVSVSICDSQFDAKLLVYEGLGRGANMSVCATGSGDCADWSAQAGLNSLRLEAGVGYMFVVDGVNGSAGVLDLRIAATSGSSVARYVEESSQRASGGLPDGGGDQGEGESGADGNGDGGPDVAEEGGSKEFSINIFGIRLKGVGLLGLGAILALIVCCCCCICTLRVSKGTPEYDAFVKSKSVAQKMHHGMRALNATRNKLGKSFKDGAFGKGGQRRGGRGEEAAEDGGGEAGSDGDAAAAGAQSDISNTSFSAMADGLLSTVRKGRKKPVEKKQCEVKKPSQGMARFKALGGIVSSALRWGSALQTAPTVSSAEHGKKGGLKETIVAMKEQGCAGATASEALTGEDVDVKFLDKAPVAKEAIPNVGEPQEVQKLSAASNTASSKRNEAPLAEEATISTQIVPEHSHKSFTAPPRQSYDIESKMAMTWHGFASTTDNPLFGRERDVSGRSFYALEHLAGQRTQDACDEDVSDATEFTHDDPPPGAEGLCLEEQVEGQGDRDSPRAKRIGPRGQQYELV